MKKHIMKAVRLLAAVLATLLVISVAPMFMTSATASETGTKKYVRDDADVLTDSEEANLQELCETTSKRCKTDIVIITLRTGKDYSVLDDYVRNILETQYGYNGSGTNCDAVAYVIDMVSRADRIVTSGNTRDSNISQSQLDSIRESAENRLKDGNYYSGCKKYISGIERRMNYDIWYRLGLYLPIKLLISLGVSVVVVLIMMHSAKAKMTVDSGTYSKDHSCDIKKQDDVFINTTVVTRHIQKNNGGGGGRIGNSGSSGGHF
jgi:uncharacterized protein